MRVAGPRHDLSGLRPAPKRAAPEAPRTYPRRGSDTPWGGNAGIAAGYRARTHQRRHYPGFAVRVLEAVATWLASPGDSGCSLSAGSHCAFALPESCAGLGPGRWRGASRGRRHGLGRAGACRPATFAMTQPAETLVPTQATSGTDATVEASTTIKRLGRSMRWTHWRACFGQSGGQGGCCICIRDRGAQAVGHFGVFQRGAEKRIWPMVMDQHRGQGTPCVRGYDNYIDAANMLR